MLNYTFFSISKIEKKKCMEGVFSKLKVERKFVWDDYTKLYA